MHDWEQRKLGDISDSFSGGTPSVQRSSYYGGDISFIRSGEINKTATELYITDEGLNRSSAKMVNKGDILYALYGATSGEVGISKINGAINQAILAIKPHVAFDSYFISQWLKNEKKIIVGTYLQGGQGNLSGSIIKKLTLILPVNLTEQEKIGQFFKGIDDTITLHQRKLEKLEKLKQALLQQMFPQKDETVPKLRFANFNDGWEQRELKNLVTRVKSYSLSRSVETNSDTNTKYIHYGDIHTHVADKIEKGTKLPNIVPGVYETLNKGDLVLADASEDYQGIATPAIVMVQTDYSLVAGLHTIALRPTKINSLYLYYLIKSPIFRKYGYKVGTGMKVFGISVNRLLEFRTLMPVTVEQCKIAELLLLMDKTITLHHHKFNQLKLLKKELLQQMFI
ncbi:restriction endonuclease subunit S [Aerococcus viridans]|uniref:restriction endonuclease subunit S n=1 Tax=Aerococcus viridans TaxID=1377 RepID=UPI000494BD1A|nr:restriction endonuclease subunit S [Aerococcus viridans]